MVLHTRNFDVVVHMLFNVLNCLPRWLPTPSNSSHSLDQNAVSNEMGDRPLDKFSIV